MVTAYRRLRAVAIGTLVSACSLDVLSRDFRPDAGSPAADAASGESAANTDTGSEASTRPRSCAELNPAPLFCDDFDHAPALSRWADRTEVSGGSLHVDDSDSLTAPSSLLVTIAPKTGPNPLAFLSTASPTPVTEAILSFDVKTDDLSREPGRSPACVLATTNRMVRFLLADVTVLNELVFDGTGAVEASQDAPAGGIGIPAATWTHVELALILAPTPHATVKIGGKVAGDLTLFTGWERAVVTAHVGVYYAETPTNGWTARFDNAVFDAHDRP